MATNSLNQSTDQRELQAWRMANKLKDPMRTRTLFYLSRLKSRKAGGETLSQEDMDRAIGRAFQDGCDDKAVAFDRGAIFKRAGEAADGSKTRSLQEVVDGVSR